MTTGHTVDVELTDDERQLLVLGLNEYLGPAAGAPVLAPLVGVATEAEFIQLINRLVADIKQRNALSDLDWAHALVLTEISWGSSLLGSGIEFASNMPDEKAAPLMRSLQYKLVTARRIELLIQNANARP
ncbi:hypothetical protein [Mycobacterium sp.]|uniref:hypothetical protein n=1 Tax=Mycobacterium sp. TaxID=1785 RepID=UPI002D9D5B48|nr:hypothetical protein [Mycobacterium sp.]